MALDAESGGRPVEDHVAHRDVLERGVVAERADRRAVPRAEVRVLSIDARVGSVRRRPHNPARVKSRRRERSPPEGLRGGGEQRDWGNQREHLALIGRAFARSATARAPRTSTRTCDAWIATLSSPVVRLQSWIQKGEPCTSTASVLCDSCEWRAARGMRRTRRAADGPSIIRKRTAAAGSRPEGSPREISITLRWAREP